MGALYVQLAQDFGWTLTEIGDLTLGDLDFIMDGWRRRPPLAAMVSAFLGVRTLDAAEPEMERREWTEDDLRAFVGAANGRE